MGGAWTTYLALAYIAASIGVVCYAFGWLAWTGWRIYKGQYHGSNGHPN